MICPVCKKDALIVEYKNIELDYCPKCHGVWFDEGELELLFEAAALGTGTGFIGKVAHSAEADTNEKKHRCPVCLRKMKKTYLDEEKKIVTDVCAGHGIWFDGGEVNTLVKKLADKSPGKEGSREVLGFIGEMFKCQS